MKADKVVHTGDVKDPRAWQTIEDIDRLTIAPGEKELFTSEEIKRYVNSRRGMYALPDVNKDKALKINMGTIPNPADTDNSSLTDFPSSVPIDERTTPQPTTRGTPFEFSKSPPFPLIRPVEPNRNSVFSTQMHARPRAVRQRATPSKVYYDVDRDSDLPLEQHKDLRAVPTTQYKNVDITSPLKSSQDHHFKETLHRMAKPPSHESLSIPQTTKDTPQQIIHPQQSRESTQMEPSKSRRFQKLKPTENRVGLSVFSSDYSVDNTSEEDDIVGTSNVPQEIPDKDEEEEEEEGDSDSSIEILSHSQMHNISAPELNASDDLLVASPGDSEEEEDDDDEYTEEQQIRRRKARKDGYIEDNFVVSDSSDIIYSSDNSQYNAIDKGNVTRKGTKRLRKKRDTSFKSSVNDDNFVDDDIIYSSQNSMDELLDDADNSDTRRAKTKRNARRTKKRQTAKSKSNKTKNSVHTERGIKINEEADSSFTRRAKYRARIIHDSEDDIEEGDDNRIETGESRKNAKQGPNIPQTQQTTVRDILPSKSTNNPTNATKYIPSHLLRVPSSTRAKATRNTQGTKNNPLPQRLISPGKSSNTSVASSIEVSPSSKGPASQPNADRKHKSFEYYMHLGNEFSKRPKSKSGVPNIFLKKNNTRPRSREDLNYLFDGDLDVQEGLDTADDKIEKTTLNSVFGTGTSVPIGQPGNDENIASTRELDQIMEKLEKERAEEIAQDPIISDDIDLNLNPVDDGSNTISALNKDESSLEETINNDSFLDNSKSTEDPIKTATENESSINISVSSNMKVPPFPIPAPAPAFRVGNLSNSILFPKQSATTHNSPLPSMMADSPGDQVDETEPEIYGQPVKRTFNLAKPASEKLFVSDDESDYEDSYVMSRPNSATIVIDGGTSDDIVDVFNGNGGIGLIHDQDEVKLQNLSDDDSEIEQINADEFLKARQLKA